MKYESNQIESIHSIEVEKPLPIDLGDGYTAVLSSKNSWQVLIPHRYDAQKMYSKLQSLNEEIFGSKWNFGIQGDESSNHYFFEIVFNGQVEELKEKLSRFKTKFEEEASKQRT